jgi:hypothetical protein
MRIRAVVVEHIGRNQVERDVGRNFLPLLDDGLGTEVKMIFFKVLYHFGR